MKNICKSQNFLLFYFIEKPGGRFWSEMLWALIALYITGMIDIGVSMTKYRYVKRVSIKRMQEVDNCWGT